MSRPTLLAVTLAVAVASTGCLTMSNGSSQKVPVITYPIATTIRIVDSAGQVVFEGPAPAEVTLSRSEEYEFSAAAPGYRPVKLKASAETTRDNFWLACTTGMCSGGIGFVVDLVSGAIKEFEPEGVELTLLRDRGQGTASAEDLRLLVTTDVGPDGHPYVALARIP